MNSVMPGEMLHVALEAVRRGDKGSIRALDGIPAPVYVTDAEGVVTYYNEACIPFTGRRPVVGQDTWCITWRLYTEEGEYLPHDQCPMAVAIREGRAIRGVRAVAERPDGSHVNFQPYPTPLLDDAGHVVGAVNLLFDVSGPKQAQSLRAKAAQCRRMVNLMPSQREVLLSKATDYDNAAGRIEQQH